VEADDDPINIFHANAAMMTPITMIAITLSMYPKLDAVEPRSSDADEKALLPPSDATSPIPFIFAAKEVMAPVGSIGFEAMKAYMFHPEYLLPTGSDGLLHLRNWQPPVGTW
jgi:hypothetical protein